jgi:hypothetical protein
MGVSKIMKPCYTLSTTELGCALALCGYEDMANEVLSNLELLEDELKFEKFIKQTEYTLKDKGYWDESSKSLLFAEIEHFIDKLVHTRRKIRCIRENEVFFLHFVNSNEFIVQVIEKQRHYFYTKFLMEDVKELLIKKFELGKSTSEDLDEIEPLMLSEDIYNNLLQLKHVELDNLISKADINDSLKNFLKDFKKNDCKFNNISLIDMNYLDNEIEFDKILFFMPSEDFIWYVMYDNISEDEIFIVPLSTDSFYFKVKDLLEEKSYKGLLKNSR